MDVQHLGHAGFIVSQGGYRLAIDPWFYPAFLESWFPWPDNRHLLDEALRADAVYVTHAHEDHFDRQFLRQLDERTLIIVPGFRSRYLVREVRKLGFMNVEVLDHGEQLRLGPTDGTLTVTALLDQSHKEDSAVLVQAGSFRFLDSNDCELAISDWPTGIDLLACQFSGAFWYPHCYYQTRAENYVIKAAQVRDSNTARLLRRIVQTRTRAYLPSAGPAVFLDPVLGHYNSRHGIYATFDQVANFVRSAFPSVAIWPSLRAPVPDNLHEYRQLRHDEWGAYYRRDARAATTDEVNVHFTRLQRRNRRFLGDYARDIRVSTDGATWRVPLGLLRGELEEAPEPHYYLDVPPIVLRAILDGDASWETALLSNRINLHRRPDTYDTQLMGLLGFGDRPVQTLAMARQAESSGEMIIRGGVAFQRWCPHAREDLTFATVEDGVIECPRHNWRWDAATGECLSGGGLSLHVEKAQAPEVPD